MLEIWDLFGIWDLVLGICCVRAGFPSAAKCARGRRRARDAGVCDAVCRLYFTEAIVDPKADLDKDGQTSLLEAFLSASHAVGQFYAAAGRLATEHALLDDNGDGLGTPAEWFRGIRPVQKAQAGASLDGYRAHQLHLLPSASEAAMPADLRAQRDRIELQVMELRDSRAKYSEQEYFAMLEPLLREIAHLYEQADKSAASSHK